MRLRLSSLAVAGFALSHLLLVVSAAFNWAPWTHWRSLASVINDYQILTGADNTFSFFATHVASQAVVDITTTDTRGRVTHVCYERIHSEAEMRLIALSLGFVQQKLYDLLATSLAENTMRRNIDVQQVTVSLGYYSVPPLKNAKTSAPSVLNLYRGDFVRKGLVWDIQSMGYHAF